MSWTVCKSRATTGLLASVCSIISPGLISRSLLELPSYLLSASGWTKRFCPNQRCFKHLSSKLFGLGSVHNRESFFLIWSLNQNITLYSCQFLSHTQALTGYRGYLHNLLTSSIFLKWNSIYVKLNVQMHGTKGKVWIRLSKISKIFESQTYGFGYGQ